MSIILDVGKIKYENINFNNWILIYLKSYFCKRSKILIFQKSVKWADSYYLVVTDSN